MINNLLGFTNVMEYIGYIVLAIVVLLVMITIHEFGHYIAGKIFGFGILEFAIGFGPKIYKRTQKNGEIFSIRCLPLGGFCSFKGEDADDPDPTSFNNKKPWQRIIVLIAGAFMNYVLALVLIAMMFGIYGQSTCYVKKMDESIILNQNTLQEDDTILSINNRNIYLVTDFMKAIDNFKAGEYIKIKVIRNNEKKIIDVLLHSDGDFINIEDTDQLLVALGISSMGAKNMKYSFFTTIGHTFEYSFKVAGTIFMVLGQLLTGKLGINAVGGTITTIGMTASGIKSGGLNFLLMISSYIGINLAVFNLLPIPALDGSRVVFCLIEWIRRKPINRKVEAVIHFVGFIVLLGFALLVDLLKLF